MLRARQGGGQHWRGYADRERRRLRGRSREAPSSAVGPLSRTGEICPQACRSRWPHRIAALHCHGAAIRAAPARPVARHSLAMREIDKFFDVIRVEIIRALEDVDPRGSETLHWLVIRDAVGVAASRVEDSEPH